MVENVNAIKAADEELTDLRANEEIVDEIQNGINVQYNKDILCRKNKKLIIHCIKLFISSAITAKNDDECNEYVQAGYVGLLEAINAYKPGVSKFSSYAVWHIRKNLYNQYRFQKTSLFITQRYWDEIIRFQKAERQLEQEGKEINYENLAQLLDVTPYVYRMVTSAREMLSVISLNNQTYDDSGKPTEYLEFLAAEDNVEAEVTQNVYAWELKEALIASKSISKRASKMLCERYIDGMLPEDIGKQNRCSRQNVQSATYNGLNSICAHDNFLKFFVDEKTAIEEAKRRREEIIRKKRARSEYQKQYYISKKAERTAPYAVINNDSKGRRSK